MSVDAASAEQLSAGNALISVYDKTGIEEFAAGLHELNWSIYGSDGTCRALDNAGIPATNVAELVGDPFLNHKVVTLSREIGAALLANVDDPEEMAEMRRYGYPIIHMLCQDSYPLEAEIWKPGSTPESVTAQTDIGGPNMLREAAKGGRIVLSVPEQRQLVLDWLRSGRPDEAEFVQSLAKRARYEVARYTMLEAKYWNRTDMSGYIGLKVANTKYGENPWQPDSALYADNRVAVATDPLGLDQFKHVKGMELSFINETDMERTLQTATHIAAGFERNFGEVPPMAIGVKHGNACGAAVAETMVEAVQQMLEGDTRAIFGGVVMINGVIDKDVAEALMWHANDSENPRLLDGVVGAAVTDEALEILSRNKLRVVVNPALAELREASLDSSRRVRPVRGGVLEQPNYDFVLDLTKPDVKHYGPVSEKQERDMVLAWAIGSTSNSNTITIVKDGVLIGNGVGQQDRVGAGQLALSRTTTELPEFKRTTDDILMTVRLSDEKLEGAVAYSDSFFPFTDGPVLLAQNGIRAILTSSGSVADKDVIEALRNHGTSVVMVPDKAARGFYGH